MPSNLIDVHRLFGRTYCLHHHGRGPCVLRNASQETVIFIATIWRWPRHSSSGYSLASHRGGPGSILGLVKWDLCWTKWRWGRFPPSTSVSPANLHSTKFSIITITRGTYNRPFSGDVPSGPNWTPPPTMRMKENHLAPLTDKSCKCQIRVQRRMCYDIVS
jgi:hypothetical protein